jgi:hypothetical protein
MLFCTALHSLELSGKKKGTALHLAKIVGVALYFMDFNYI